MEQVEWELLESEIWEAATARDCDGQVPDLTLAAVADFRASRRQWARENLPEDQDL